MKVKKEDSKTYITSKHKEYAENLAKYGLRYTVPKEGGPRVVYTDNGFKLLIKNNKSVGLFIEFLEKFDKTFKGGNKNVNTKKNQKA